MRAVFVRKVLTVLVVAPLAAGTAACDDDGPTGPQPIPLTDVAGVYDPVSFTFDPQGAAVTGDVLSALEASGYDMELNIAEAGTFQIVYRDPTTGEVRILSGQVQALVDGVELTFASQGAADQLVLPRDVRLEWDETTGTLSFSGLADVSRARLQQLFPMLYGDEPWTTATIPGTLTISFTPTTIQAT